MKRCFLFFSILVLSFACKDDDNTTTTCGTNDPVNDLGWLKAEIELRESNKESGAYQYFYIQQATYLGQTVFIYNGCCPMCGFYVPVLNCSGQEIFQLDAENSKSLRNVRLLWAPEEFQCVL